METKKKVILALSWRDIKAPKKGGAEVHTHEMLKGLDKSKYEVYHFSPMFEGAEKKEEIDGITYIRKGNPISVIWHARMYYLRHAKNIDHVIDQCNTHRFFTKFWVPRKKRIFYIHQLTREIWDINAKFPINVIGRTLETPMLKLNNKDYTITVSNSTKEDLVNVGFDKDKIFIIPNGVSKKLYEYRETKYKPYVKKNDFIYVGRYSKYKGIDVCVKALASVKKKYKDARLFICGKKDDEFINEVLQPLCDELSLSLYDYATYGDENVKTADVIMFGFTSESKKYNLMNKSRALLFPSLREGWGIIVTEAGYLNTPSIVYDSPGVRDAVNLGNAGYLCKKNNVDNISELMIRSIEDKEEYKQMSENALKYAMNFNWDNNGAILDDMLNKIEEIEGN